MTERRKTSRSVRDLDEVATPVTGGSVVSSSLEDGRPAGPRGEVPVDLRKGEDDVQHGHGHFHFSSLLDTTVGRPVRMVLGNFRPAPVAARRTAP